MADLNDIVNILSPNLYDEDDLATDEDVVEAVQKLEEAGILHEPVPGLVRLPIRGEPQRVKKEKPGLKKLGISGEPQRVEKEKPAFLKEAPQRVVKKEKEDPYAHVKAKVDTGIKKK